MSQKHTKTHQAITGRGSALKKYQAVMVGSDSLWTMLYYEVCTWFAYVPGALGLLLRKVFWPRLFKQCGKGNQFGFGIVLRHPGRISLGSNVVISEYCILDARNPDQDMVISIADDVMLASAVSLSAKGGSIDIGTNTGIGMKTTVQSTHACPVEIGEDCIIGPHCYLVGGGNYHLERLDIPIHAQGIKPDSGCQLCENVWLGGQVSVLGDVVMEAGSVAATGAVVTKRVAQNVIVGGVPARVIRNRG